MSTPSLNVPTTDAAGNKTTGSNPLLSAGLAGVGGLIASLFGNNAASTGATNIENQLTASANTSTANANTTFGQAEGGITALQQYLQPLLSGDRQALTQAAAPQIAQITNQYDTAYQTISQLGPRGGGTNSAEASLRGKEASDVANTVNNERTQALTAEQQLVQTLLGSSATNSATSQSALSTALQGLLTQSGQNQQSSSSLGSGIGSLLGLLAFI